MTVDELRAREAIRHAIATYTIAGDEMDADVFASVFTEDGIFEFAGFGPVPSFSCEGREVIRQTNASWQSAWQGKDGERPSYGFTRHNLTTCHIEVTGPESAKARTYWIVYTDNGPDHSGTYDDDFRRVGDAWLIAHRKIRVDWRSPGSLFPPVD